MINHLLIYIFLSFIVFYVIAKISYKYLLLDFSNYRKIHSKPTAYTGGFAISIIFIILLIYTTDEINFTLSSILSSAFLISLVGLVDDIYDLNVGGKLSLQIIPIFYISLTQDLLLNTLGDYYYFQFDLGSFQTTFTILSVLLLINSFNYFDGMDGTLSSITISVLSILFFLNVNQEFRFFLVVISVPLMIFLFFNFSLLKLPKMFLGDSGSLLLGFVISFILIYAAKKDFIHPILLAWSVAIFVYEFLSVNIIRIRNNKNPFKAGKDHLHHVIFEITKSVFLTNLIIISINFILFVVGYSSHLFISPIASLFLYITMFILFLFLRLKFLK